MSGEALGNCGTCGGTLFEQVSTCPYCHRSTGIEGEVNGVMWGGLATQYGDKKASDFVIIESPYKKEPSDLRILFDFNFTRFLYPRLIKHYYIAALIFGVIMLLSTITALFSEGSGSYTASAATPDNRAWGLFLALLGFYIFWITTRFVLETFMLFFRIYESVRNNGRLQGQWFQEEQRRR